MVDHEYFIHEITTAVFDGVRALPYEITPVARSSTAKTTTGSSSAEDSLARLGAIRKERSISIKVIVRTLTGELHEFNLNTSSSGEDLARLVEEKKGIPLSQQSTIFERQKVFHGCPADTKVSQNLSMARFIAGHYQPNCTLMCVDGHRGPQRRAPGYDLSWIIEQD